MTKMDETYADPEWVKIKSLKIAKFNRTTTVVKGAVEFLKDIPDTVLVSRTYSILFPSIIWLLPFHRF